MKKTIWVLGLIAVVVLAACTPAVVEMESEPVMEEAAVEAEMPEEEMAAADSEVIDLEMPEQGYVEIDALAAQALMEATPDLVVIDVSPSYDQGHLPGAISIPVNQLEGRLGELDPANPHLVYCHGDGPAIRAAEILAANGFSPVYRLLGNYAGWVNAGLPVEK